jgi:uncharacterized GH25 family protein
MKRKLLGTVAVVGAVVGAWWWWTDRTASAPAASVATPGRSEDVAGDQARPRGREPEPGTPARAMIGDDPAGTLRLEGQVVDVDGHGVAGATVIITATPPRTLITEADGSFAFDRLIGRQYTLIARAARAVAGPITTRLTDRSEPVVLALRPAGMLTVVVVDRDGKSINGAIVELRGVDEQRAVVKGEAAVFSPVVPGSYQLVAWAEHMAHTFQRIQIGAGDASARMVLASGAPVTGRVIDDRGDGVGDAQVRWSGASDWIQQADDRRDGTVTAADGSFRFDVMPAGSFRFIASHPERAPGISPLVTLDGTTQRDGVVIALAVGAVVRGRVVDAQHRPVGSARIRISDAASLAAMPLEAPRQTYSDALGAFELRGLPRARLAAVARNELGASRAVAVDTTAGDVAGLTLTLDVTGTIAGMVVDPQGQPVEGAQVTAERELGDSGRTPAGRPSRFRDIAAERTDASGMFTLTGLVDGTYRLSAAPASRARGRGDLRTGVTAATGDTHVRLVVAPDGGVKGRVAFSDGTAPALFSVSAAQTQQSFLGGDGSFLLDGLAPATYQVEVRGPGFQTRVIEVTVASSAIADAGTITVVRGRSVAGTVVADGRPVAGATVYAGRRLFGSGTTSSSPPETAPPAAALGEGTKTTTTDASGRFSLSGFAGGDVTLAAEHEAIGRSRALRLPEAMPGQTELTLNLEKFGTLGGTLRQAGQPVNAVMVTCQSTTAPGALYRVMTGADGAFRFDRLAPDVYKVSATLRAARLGARFYSKVATVPAGKEVTVDLTVDPGTVALEVTMTADGGAIGAASAWLASGTITAGTLTELMLKLAAAGAGTSARLGVANGESKRFTDLVPGPYSVCITPLPLAVRAVAALDYMNRHSDSLATFCTAITVAPAPSTQAVDIAVELPPLIPDAPGGKAGSAPRSEAGG